jgi:hypothetical protein
MAGEPWASTSSEMSTGLPAKADSAEYGELP